MKTEFYLTPNAPDYRGMKIDIIGKKSKGNKPYISVGYVNRTFGTMTAKDLERFAVNILKSIDSEYLR